MPLQIHPSTSIERKNLAIETIINTTDKVSKISDEAILSGIGGGMAKISGKAEKDIVLALSGLYPDTAFGSQLDIVAKNFGISARFGALGSSCYVRISATPGTIYLANTHQFRSTTGVTFNLDEDYTVPAFGFGYARISSVTTGANTNVDPLTISIVSPAPAGHIAVINEYKADGGRDIESDEIFRIRIKDGANILAKGTIAMLEQKFMSINPKVLRVYHGGRALNGKITLNIQTQNGSNLSNTELGELLEQSADFFALSEYSPYGNSFFGIELTNIQYGFVDLFFRCKLNTSYDPDEVRKQIQVNVSKYLDPRFFNPMEQKVEWDNLLEIVKNTPGIDYVADEYFYPRSDIMFTGGVIPRLRGFLMLDMAGQIISNFQGTLSPQYYPNLIDESYISTVLNS